MVQFDAIEIGNLYTLRSEKLRMEIMEIASKSR